MEVLPGAELPGQEAEERGFAAAVGANDPDFLRSRDGEPNVLRQEPPTSRGSWKSRIRLP